MAFGYRHTQQSCRRKPWYLVGYSVGVWRGAGDVVETVGDGGVLHDITGMDDVRACGRDLNLDLTTNTCGLGAQAHPGQQLGNFLSGLTVRRTGNKHCSLKSTFHHISEDTLILSS